MTCLPAILSINGSEPTGEVGIGADIRTISALGGSALAVVISITAQTETAVRSVHDMPSHLVAEQIQTALHSCRPLAVKVGMLRDPQTIAMLPRYLSSLPNRVMVSAVTDSRGHRLLSPQAVDAWMKHLLPLASLLMVRVCDAEVMLGRTITTDMDMLVAAAELMSLGAGAVMLRGGHIQEGHITALLMYEGGHRFFSSQNVTGWQRHGVSGTLSSAIATRYAMGDNTTQAVANAHSYMHSRVVYAVSGTSETPLLRPADIYNAFLSLLAGNYTSAHDVSFYAARLCVSPRYLRCVTDKTVGRSPKQVISDYIMREACSMLHGTRFTIQEISQHLGFSSQAQFARFFAKEKGCSPQSYRFVLSLSE